MRRRRGSATIEFALVGIQLLVVIFAAIEFGRMVLVYTTIANSARAGLRYAIVHGSTRTGTGADGPSSQAATTYIENTVRNFARAGPLNAAALQVQVTYPDTVNSPGSRVSVQVLYPYDPLVVLPLGITIGSVSQGVIVF